MLNTQESLTEDKCKKKDSSTINMLSTASEMMDMKRKSCNNLESVDLKIPEVSSQQMDISSSEDTIEEDGIPLKN